MNNFEDIGTYSPKLKCSQFESESVNLEMKEKNRHTRKKKKIKKEREKIHHFMLFPRVSAEFKIMEKKTKRNEMDKQQQPRVKKTLMKMKKTMKNNKEEQA